MNKLLAVSLLALSASLSQAKEPAQVFALRARTTAGPVEDVRLELYPKGWDRFVVKRITKGRSGAPDQILVGAARVQGRYLGVRFAMREGVENKLAGTDGASDITGVYRISGRQILGVLQNPTNVNGWSQCYDKGFVVPANQTRRAPPSSPPPARRRSSASCSAWTGSPGGS